MFTATVYFQLPIVGTDWWEPIYSIETEDIIGQAKILIALGTEEQIDNLKLDRGFNIKFVTANNHRQQKLQPRAIVTTNSENSVVKDAIHNKTKVCSQNKPILSSNKTAQKQLVSKQDATTQVDVECDLHLNRNQKMDKQVPTVNNATSDLLGSFLNHLISHSKQNTALVENSTNTEINETNNKKEENLQKVQTETNANLKKTSDLLDSLEKAIAVDKIQHPQNSPSRKGKQQRFFYRSCLVKYTRE